MGRFDAFRSMPVMQLTTSLSPSFMRNLSSRNANTLFSVIAKRTDIDQIPNEVFSTVLNKLDIDDISRSLDNFTPTQIQSFFNPTRLSGITRTQSRDMMYSILRRTDIDQIDNNTLQRLFTKLDNAEAANLLRKFDDAQIAALKTSKPQLAKKMFTKAKPKLSHAEKARYRSLGLGSSTIIGSVYYAISRFAKIFGKGPQKLLRQIMNKGPSLFIGFIIFVATLIIMLLKGLFAILQNNDT